MPHFDSVYGDLLTSREVADLTGFTINQLRNHRARPETSPFNFIRQGGTSWYRKDDINLWLEQNGTTGLEYIRVPNAPTAPLLNPTATGERKAHLDELSKITTRNSFSVWYTWFVESGAWHEGNVKAYDKVREWMKYYYELKFGSDLGKMYPDQRAWGLMRRNNPVDYWPAITYAMRKAVSEVKGYEATDEEILSAPVGDVPPLKQD